MKKNKKVRIVNMVSQVFNVRSWVDFDRLRAFSTYFASGFQRMFVPQKNQEAEKSETFKTAVNRLHLNDSELQKKQTALLRLSRLMCLVAASLLSYGVYHLIDGSLRAFLISITLTLVALTLAFRYHFWYFQIKERKLGCTFQEWFKKGLKGEK